MQAGPVLDRLFSTERLRRIALVWVAVSVIALAFDLVATCALGSDMPCMADYPDFALAARLMLMGRARAAYDLVAFQNFALRTVPHARDIYQYAYPPFLMLLTGPLGLLPFWAGWVLWIGGGWVALALCIRRLTQRHWLLMTAALPAVLVNAVAGQNGLWTAAILGWGLMLVPRSPILSGAILSLILCKPQLAPLVPIALLSGREWRALGGFLAGGLALAGVPALLFGPGIWGDFLHHGQMVRAAILEDGATIWHRMLSVFVLLRHAGLPVRACYAVQACATLGAACGVARSWWLPGNRRTKNAILVLGIVLGAPYVFDYDLAVLALVPIWLSGAVPVRVWRAAAFLCVILPLVEAPLASWTGLAAGSIVIAALFLVLLHSATNERRPDGGIARERQSPA